MDKLINTVLRVVDQTKQGNYNIIRLFNITATITVCLCVYPFWCMKTSLGEKIVDTPLRQREERLVYVIVCNSYLHWIILSIYMFKHVIHMFHYCQVHPLLFLINKKF